LAIYTSSNNKGEKFKYVHTSSNKGGELKFVHIFKQREEIEVQQRCTRLVKVVAAPLPTRVHLTAGKSPVTGDFPDTATERDAVTGPVNGIF